MLHVNPTFANLLFCTICTCKAWAPKTTTTQKYCKRKVYIALYEASPKRRFKESHSGQLHFSIKHRFLKKQLHIKRILYGRAEIRNFSSSAEKYFTSECSERVKYFQHEKRNFVFPSGHVMFYLSYKHQWNTKPFHWNSFIPRKARFIM